MGFEFVFLAIVALLAFLIIVGTAIAVIIILRRPTAAQSEAAANLDIAGVSETPASETIAAIQSTSTPSPHEDIEAYLVEQKKNLIEFELKDLSNSFQGTTSGGERQGVILHLSLADSPLVVFASRISSQQNGTIVAETAYGKMEVIIAQGRAGVQWNDAPMGILEFSKQRILGPQGQLLGSMERPLPDNIGASELGAYPISFFGEKVADVTMSINALSALRWFGDDDAEQTPAFENLATDLEDDQTLLLLGALLLEIGFFNLL